MSEPIINRPHALYYNGELIGIVTNPDPHGDISSICEGLSPDEGLADAVTIPTRGGKHPELWEQFKDLITALGVATTVELETYEDDE